MWHLLAGAVRPGRLRLVQATKRLAHSDCKDVPISYPAVCIWGANTGVGKTLVSAGLVAAAVRNQVQVQYIKPVQTGYPQDSDSRLVAAAATHVAGSAAAAKCYLVRSDTLFTYKDPVSPHLAAAQEQRVISDDTIVTTVTQQLQQFTAELDTKRQQQQRDGSSSSSSSGSVRGLSVIETAGGVTSPGSSGTLQADILRPLALPALLVGDPNLGGISTTLSSYESLLLHGHVAAAVVMMTEDRYDNVTAVRHHLRHAATHRLGQPLPVLALPMCKPSLPAAAAGSATASFIDDHLSQWLLESRDQFDQLLLLIQQQHDQRISWLSSAAAGAAANVWWPFTQHAQLPNKEITVVDARSGENWLVLKQQHQQQDATAASSSSSLAPLHDAASSWWTQTAAAADLQVEVTRAVAAAAARYMHVMWPQVAHAPGLELTRALLSPPFNAGGWANRVFFSDDGSTAVEVALKMALRKFMVDHNMLYDTNNTTEEQPMLEVLALQNSYHGDTHGAMDCASASPFNGRLQTPWYKGRGLFLEPPYLQLQKGRWCLQTPEWLQQQQQQQQGGGNRDRWAWTSKPELFDMKGRSRSDLQQLYHKHITAAIDAHEATTTTSSSSSSGRRRLGALLIEPVLQGAGGMLLVDPLFQVEMVKVAKSRGIPAIFDEVFTGCWRLGSPTAAALLGVTPDIACYAKLLTGGAAPLAVTVTTEAVFDAFKGPSKIEALLHGHSYTAYPLGCAAALASLAIIQDPDMNPNVCTPALPHRCERALSVVQGNSCSSSSSSSDEDEDREFIISSSRSSNDVQSNFGSSNADSSSSSSSHEDWGGSSNSNSSSIGGVQGISWSSDSDSSSSSDDNEEDNSSSNSSSSNSVQGNSNICPCKESCGQLLPQWNEAAAIRLSHHSHIRGIVVLGSVLAIELNPDSSSGTLGYSSGAAVDVVAALRARGIAARPLGAVVYLMVTPTTSREKCEWLMSQLSEVLDMEEGWGKSGGGWVLI